jgi:predicted phosphodiesterase
MRFAIISDIHANLPALDAVLKDMKTYHIDHIICLGDIIGYGPFPSECLNRIREVTNYVIMGNHESAAAGIFDVDLFQDEAKEHILWTREQLSKDDMDYIKSLHYMLDFETFMISHATFTDPDCFAYIETEEEAKVAFSQNELKLMFIGHTHIPIVHRMNIQGEYAAITKDIVKMNPAWRYIVNPGAVGLSRDEQFSAGYLIFDTELYKVFMRRVNYSLKPLYEAVKTIARDPQHQERLLERFRPRAVLKIKHQAAISKSGIREAVMRHRQEHM